MSSASSSASVGGDEDRPGDRVEGGAARRGTRHGLRTAGRVLDVERVHGEEVPVLAVSRWWRRADVNNAVKRLLDVRKASFLPMDRATTESGMELSLIHI